MSPIGTALRFFQKGPADRRVHVAGGNVPGRGTFGWDEVCLPAWARGLAIPISFQMLQGMPPCSAAAAIIDDASLVTSPACGDGLLFDGGFEGYVSYWLTRRINPQVTAQIVGSSQRSGSKALRFEVYSCIGSAHAYQGITVPPAKGASRPAVAFWANGLSEVSASMVRFSLNGEDVTPGAPKARPLRRSRRRPTVAGARLAFDGAMKSTSLSSPFARVLGILLLLASSACRGNELARISLAKPGESGTTSWQPSSAATARVWADYEGTWNGVGNNGKNGVTPRINPGLSYDVELLEGTTVLSKQTCQTSTCGGSVCKNLEVTKGRTRGSCECQMTCRVVAPRAGTFTLRASVADAGGQIDGVRAALVFREGVL